LSGVREVKRCLASAFLRDLARILREQRWTLLAVFLVHLVGIAIGYHAGRAATPEEALQFFEEFTAPHWYDRILPSAAGSFSGHTWAWFFCRNVLGCLLSFFTGTVTVGLFALGIASRLGYDVGWLTGSWTGVARQASGAGPAGITAGILLPHALLEFPAVLLAWALALRAGLAWVRPLPSLQRWASVKRLWCDFVLSLLAIIPLLFGAALLEAYANPPVAYRYLLGIGRYSGMVREEVVGRPCVVSQSAWSPDGAYLAALDQSGTRLWLRRVEGDSPTVLVARAGEDAWFSSLSWSPDGKHIALTSAPFHHEDMDRNRLVLLDIASKKVHSVEGGPFGRYLWASWSPTANSVAVVILEFARDQSRTRGANVWVVSLDSGRWEKVTSFRPGGDTALGGGVSWRPDGGAIAFVRLLRQGGEPRAHIRHRRTGAVSIVSRDGARLREVTRVTHSTALAWSPDGEWIAFTAGADVTPPGEEEATPFSEVMILGDIGVVRPDGSQRVDGLARADLCSSLSWSPDGNQLAYQRVGTCIIGTPRVLSSP